MKHSSVGFSTNFCSYFIADDKDSNKVTHYLYRTHSSNRPLIIFLHGFPETNYAWCEMLIRFYNTGYDVLAPNLRGNSLSDGYSALSDFCMELYLSDIKKMIDRHAKQKVIFIGHDIGAMIAWKYIEKYPNAYQAMIAICGPHHGAFSKLFHTHPFKALRQLRRFWYMFLFRLPWLPVKIIQLWNFYSLDVLFRHERRDCHEKAKAILSFYKMHLNKNNRVKKSISFYKKNLPGKYGRMVLLPFLYGKEFITVQKPVLIIGGEKDFTLEEQVFEETKKLCADCEYELLNNVGHWPHHEVPEELFRLITIFLNKRYTKPVALEISAKDQTKQVKQLEHAIRNLDKIYLQGHHDNVYDCEIILE